MSTRSCPNWVNTADIAWGSTVLSDFAWSITSDPAFSDIVILQPNAIRVHIEGVVELDYVSTSVSLFGFGTDDPISEVETLDLNQTISYVLDGGALLSAAEATEHDSDYDEN